MRKTFGLQTTRPLPHNSRLILNPAHSPVTGSRRRRKPMDRRAMDTDKVSGVWAGRQLGRRSR